VTDQPGEAYVHRYSQLLKRLLGSRSGEPIDELGRELLATIILENDRPEYGHISNDDLCAGRIFTAATAAVNSAGLFRNPAGSNIIATFYRLVTSQFSTQAIFTVQKAANSTGTFVATTAGMFRDLRRSGLTVVTISQYQNNGVTGVIFDSETSPAKYDQPVVVAPGFDLIVWNSTQNAQADISGAWRERTMEPGETVSVG
jgi:hypothetical protein